MALCTVNLYIFRSTASPVDNRELAAASSNIAHLFRACTWPIPSASRKRKRKRFARLLNLHRYTEPALVRSNTEDPNAPANCRSLLSRAAMLAFKNLDLGPAPPNQLSRALNRQAVTKATQSSLDDYRISTRSSSPPPSEFSSVSSDEVIFFLSVSKCIVTLNNLLGTLR